MDRIPVGIVPRGGLGRIFHVGGGPVVIGRRVGERIALGRQQAANETVVGHVVANRSHQPAVKLVDTGGTKLLACHAEQVSPPPGPEAGMIFAGQQPGDQPRPPIRTPVGQEGPRLLDRRQQAGHIQRHATQELAIGQQRRGHDLHFLEPGKRVPIHLVDHRGFVPDKAGPIFQKRQPRGLHLVEKADQDSHLPDGGPCHPPGNINLGQRLVRTAVDGQVGHVARRPVGEMGDHLQLLRDRRGLQEAVAGKDLCSHATR